DRFLATGQNSHTKPPAQDQSQWQSLLNVQPITEGILNQRWGYTGFVGQPVPSILFSPNRLYNFESDAVGTRAIIAASVSGISSFTEAGAPYNTDIFTPVAAAGTVRSITSRNYQYFCDGNNALTSAHRTGDSLKWSGVRTSGV